MRRTNASRGQLTALPRGQSPLKRSVIAGKTNMTKRIQILLTLVVAICLFVFATLGIFKGTYGLSKELSTSHGWPEYWLSMDIPLNEDIYKSNSSGVAKFDVEVRSWRGMFVSFGSMLAIAIILQIPFFLDIRRKSLGKKRAAIFYFVVSALFGILAVFSVFSESDEGMYFLMFKIARICMLITISAILYLSGRKLR